MDFAPTPDAGLAALVPALRKGMSLWRTPGGGDRVHKHECSFSFDTPESAGGLLVSLSTHEAVAPRFAALDRRRTGSLVYLHVCAERRLVAPDDAAAAPPADSSLSSSSSSSSAEPTKLALGVPGGFADTAPGAREELVESHSVVVFAEGAPEGTAPVGVVPLPPSAAAVAALPGFLFSVCDALIAHKELASAAGSAAWAGDVKEVSRHALELPQLPRVDGAKGSAAIVSPNPADWACAEPGCDKRTNLWLNLSDGFVGCGRALVGLGANTGGNGHALKHYHGTGGIFPLCVKLGSLTPEGGDVYSYDPKEDNSVLDPELGQHLRHWGIDIMRMAKTEGTTEELELDANKNFTLTSKALEDGVELVKASGAGLIGLENLGNSCYVNSVLQGCVLALPELRDAYMRVGAAGQAAGEEGSPARRLFETAPSGRGQGGPAEDLLCQVAKLFVGVFAQPNRYAAVPAPLAGALEPGSGGACGFVTPRMLRTLLGKGHVDFSTSRQQDAAEFLMWALQRFGAAHQQARVSGRLRGSDAPPEPSTLFTLSIEERTECSVTHAVRYRVARGDTVMRLRIPIEAAENRAEVDAARLADAAVMAAAKAATDAATAQAKADKERADLERGIVPVPPPEDIVVDDDERTSTAAGAGAAGNEAKRPRTDAGPAASVAPEALPARAELPKYRVPFGACLQSWCASSEVADFESPNAGRRVPAFKSVRIAAFPPYLALCLERYRMGASWTNVKVDAEVAMPLDLDFEAAAPGAEAFGDRVASLRARGLQPGEMAMATDAPAGAAAAAAAPAKPKPSEVVVEALISMGFADGACRRACVASGNAGAEQAFEWLSSHMDDSDFNAPYVEEAAPAPASSSAAAAADFPAADVAILCDMGFPEPRARKALRETGGSVERATDWLVSHTDDADDVMDVGAAGAGASSSAGAGAGAGAAVPEAVAEACAAARGRYTLLAIISHIGSNLSSGHYVAHVRKAPGGLGAAAPSGDAAADAAAGVRWFFFNDGKVGESGKPPLDAGFLYVYRRV